MVLLDIKTFAQTKNYFCYLFVDVCKFFITLLSFRPQFLLRPYLC